MPSVAMCTVSLPPEGSVTGSHSGKLFESPVYRGGNSEMWAEAEEPSVPNAESSAALRTWHAGRARAGGWVVCGCDSSWPKRPPRLWGRRTAASHSFVSLNYTLHDKPLR